MGFTEGEGGSYMTRPLASATILLALGASCGGVVTGGGPPACGDSCGGSDGSALPPVCYDCQPDPSVPAGRFVVSALIDVGKVAVGGAAFGSIMLENPR